VKLRFAIEHKTKIRDQEQQEMYARAILLRRMTTKQLEDDMSAPDLDLLLSLYDVLEKRENDMIAYAVNRAMVGDKHGK
jgi:DNA-binding XRE family transcriptional regulator